MNNKKSNKKLSKPTDQRLALLRSLSISLVLNETIITTTPRAKQVISFLESIITRAKSDTVHSRREVFKSINNKDFVKRIFEKAKLYSDRPGGYIRIQKCGFRKGDSAEVSQLQFV